jgi:hypothetical protein
VSNLPPATALYSPAVPSRAPVHVLIWLSTTQGRTLFTLLCWLLVISNQYTPSQGSLQGPSIAQLVTGSTILEQVRSQVGDCPTRSQFALPLTLLHALLLGPVGDDKRSNQKASKATSSSKTGGKKQPVVPRLGAAPTNARENAESVLWFVAVAGFFLTGGCASDLSRAASSLQDPVSATQVQPRVLSGAFKLPTQNSWLLRTMPALLDRPSLALT